MQSAHRDKLLNIAIGKKADPFTVSVLTIEGKYRTVLEIKYPSAATDKKWQFQVSDDALLKFDSEAQLVQFILHTIETMKEQAYADLYSEFGEYPDIRLWAIDHGSGTLTPNDEIPKWVYPRWNSKHPGMKARKQGGIVDKNFVEPIRELTINEDGSETVATAKRTVKVVKASDRQSVVKKTAKKPYCKVHTNSQMKFNAIRNLWECPEVDCNFVGRPKGDDSSGNVIIGKGAVELRLVYTGEADSPRVILQSDNNVVLDITDHVDRDNLIAQFSVASAVRQAQNQGVEVTRIATQDVPLRMSLVVLGIGDYRS